MSDKTAEILRMVNRPPAVPALPPHAFEDHPAGGVECYVIDCGGCDKKIYSLGRECICPHCGAWLVLTWPVKYVSKGRRVTKA